MFRLLVLMAFMAASLLLIGLGEAQERKIDPQGEPKSFQAGESVRYAIWHNKYGWHVRTTTAKKEHRFHGTITIEGGVFEKAHSHDLEKEGKLRDGWRVNNAKNELALDFRTNKAVDGIDFTVSSTAKRIRFHLHTDGKFYADRIFIGRDEQHPESDPFLVSAHPAKK